LIGNAVLDLIDAGALADGPSVTSGVAIGSPALYAAIESPKFVFRPVSYTHDARVIAGIKDFVAINSVIEVDLFGQAYAELGPARLDVGPRRRHRFRAWCADRWRPQGRGTALRRGKRVRQPDRGPGEGAGPVSLGRMDVDVVVTEHGAANLRGSATRRALGR
jgi:hypothetical protein